MRVFPVRVFAAELILKWASKGGPICRTYLHTVSSARHGGTLGSIQRTTFDKM